METKRVALVGQPNVGKSTLYNVLSDIKTSTSNFAGSSFTISECLIDAGLYNLRLLDIPGIYTLNPSNKDERKLIDILLSDDIDFIINVVDAALLVRSLELTVELIELGKPMIIALNMVDEAEGHGVFIDYKKLEDTLNVKVVPTVALYGKGIKTLIDTSSKAIYDNDYRSKTLEYTHHIESGLNELSEFISEQNQLDKPISRFYSIKSIECPELVPGDILNSISEQKAELESKIIEQHKLAPYESISYERHHLAMKISELVTTIRERKTKSFSDKLDDLLLRPVIGYFFIIGFFFLYFFSIFVVGNTLATLIDIPLKLIPDLYSPLMSLSPFLWSSINGAYLGFSGITGVVLPYFLPLMFLTAIFEDTGYMSRIAFLVDGAFHKIGLHGKSVVPFILGFGCSVPAIYATRIIENRRDRIITGMLIPFIPCSARIAVIFALTAAFAGPLWAIVIYLYVGIVLGINGKIMSKFLSQPTGLILEIPRLKVPSLKMALKKTNLKIIEFLKEASIFLIAGSVVLGWIEYFNLSSYIDNIFSPIIKSVLGLPAELGSTLVFGFFRKELILIMANQALGVDSIANLPLTLQQIIVFIVFVTFYFPCLTTFIVIIREFGKKAAILSAILSIIVAVLSAFIFKTLFDIF